MKKGPLRESNPWPLVPKTRIMPLDQAATQQFQLAPMIHFHIQISNVIIVHVYDHVAQW